MRAFVYDSRATGGMRFTDTARKPVLANGHVLVRVIAAAINPVDFKRPKIPYIGWGLTAPVGQDFSGIVQQSSSPNFSIGDAVYGKNEPTGNTGGCIAEFCTPVDSAIALKPTGISFAQAAALPTVGLTSLQALRKAGLSKGGRVIVVGASGGCGTIAVQLASAIVGPTGVVGAVCGTQNVQFVQSLAPGAIVADYRIPGAIVGPSSALRAAGPYDCVYDTVTSPDSGDNLDGVPYDIALRPLLRPGGLVVAINGSAARWAAALLGWQAAGYHLLMQRDSGAELAELKGFVEAGQLVPVLDEPLHAFDAAGCSAAFERLRSRRARGKVVIQVAPEPET
jgi:NADPH:quinone reductase-like Zn-dependent oxidoreductase